MTLFTKPYLTKETLASIKDYKYHSQMSGLFDIYIGTPFWNWCAQFLPSWLSPNVITLLGFLHLISFSCLVMFINQDMKTSIPSWIYIFSTYCMIAQQTLDALDGKQARITQTSSELGQILDHGCDAIGSSIVSCVNCALMQLGKGEGLMNGLLPLAMIVFQISSFFLNIWEESLTHIMRFSFVSISEAQLFMIISYLMIGIFGEEVLFYKSLFNLQTRQIMALITLVGFIIQLYALIVVFRSPRVKNKLFAFLLLLRPICFFIMLSFAIFYTPLFSLHPNILFLTYTILYAHLNVQLMLFRFSQMEVPLFHIIYLPFVLSIIISWVLFHPNFSFFKYQYLASWLLYFSFFWAIFILTHYFISIVLEMSRGFDIPIFSVKKNKKRKNI